jgi:pimeloyl-ACP methyl ester carboxylesterase
MTGWGEDDGADRALSAARREHLTHCELRVARVGSGTPVLLMHTLGGILEYFEPLVAALDRTRCDVIAVDLPGHGESTAAPVEHTAGYFADTIEELLGELDVSGAVLAGDSIGASIALILAARRNPRVAAVVAVNPYDYGNRGGARRNSPLANVLFTTLLLPGIGAVAAHAEIEWMVRSLLRSGLHDPDRLPSTLPGAIHRRSSLPGHPRAFRSLMRQWRTWIDARKQYPRIDVPVVLAYGAEDWANPVEREENARAIPHARVVTLERAGHFASLDCPADVAALIESVLPAA